MDSNLSQQITLLPHQPGVYIYKDTQGQIIYVGKSNNIHNRVLQYFHPLKMRSPKLKQLTMNITNIDFIVTNSDEQALIIESDLIKKYKPKFNIRFKDDKSYPYIKINIEDKWPTVSIARRILNDGGIYFGPYTDAGNVRNILRVIKKTFPFRTCKTVKNNSDSKACLNYHINRCPAPCINAISENDYLKTINSIIAFLDGKRPEIIKDLRTKMHLYSNIQDYERAAITRDQMHSITTIIQNQKLSLPIRGSRDAIAFVKKGNQAFATILSIRNNQLISHNNFLFEGVEYETPQEIISAIIKQFYSMATNIPVNIILQNEPNDRITITDWLSHLRKGKVNIVIPTRGAEKRLVETAKLNASKGLEYKESEKYYNLDYPEMAQNLKKILHLKNIPDIIEAYDISNIRGNYSVGCLVVFEKGRTKKELYRKFKIRIDNIINDYSMIQETLQRRFRNYLANNEKWKLLPNLIVIDGGIGHLNAALEIIKLLHINIDVISIAKQNEQIYIPNSNQPINLDNNSPVLHFIQRIRDEVHRYAITYHRNIRDKAMKKSVLDDIPGIGQVRKRELLKRFGSIDRIRKCKISDLIGIAKIDRKLAKLILQYIN